MSEPVTAEELASLDSQFSIDDWREDMKWLFAHGYKIVRLND